MSLSDVSKLTFFLNTIYLVLNCISSGLEVQFVIAWVTVIHTEKSLKSKAYKMNRESLTRVYPLHNFLLYSAYLT